MVFSSLTFLTLFFPCVLIFYFSRSSLSWRNGVLLAFSLLFYAWGEPVWVLAMIASTVINYICAITIEKAPSLLARQACLVVGVIASLAALFYFKYAAFLFNSITGLFGSGLRMPVLELPVGISFYTFQVLTYTVDVYRKKSPVQRSFPKLMLYISCFPQLIAGPIVQYTDVAAMLDDRTSTLDGRVQARFFLDGEHPDLSSLDNILQCALGTSHFVFLTADGQLTALGDNTYGQCDLDSLAPLS